MKNTLGILSSMVVASSLAMAQPAGSSAAQAFDALKKASIPPKPAMSAVGRSFSQQDRDASDAAQAAAYRTIATQARQFQVQHPGDANASHAKKIEITALFGAARNGDVASEQEALTLAESFIQDARHSRKNRYLVAATVQQWNLDKKKLRDRNAEFGAYEKASEELYSQFSDVADVYHYLLGVARNAPTPQKARSLALDLLQKPAPPHIKEEAQAIIDRQDMPGKAIALKFSLTNGTEFDLAREQGRPVVIYFWANEGGGSAAAAMPFIRAAASDSATRFVGVNIDRGPMALVKAPDGIAPPGAQHWEPLGVAGAIPKQLHVAHVPSVYVFDSAGILRAFGHPRELGAMLRALRK